MPTHHNDNPHKHEHRGRTSEKILDKTAVISSLNIVSGESVLDAGCGNGYMAKQFARLAAPHGVVYALDPDSDAIDKLKHETNGTIIKPFVADITQNTQLPPDALDLIYVGMVLHGFSCADMDGFAKEVTRLLKPGGRLAVVEIKKEKTPFGPPLEIRYSPEELRQRIPLMPMNLKDAGQYLYLQMFGN